MTAQDKVAFISGGTGQGRAYLAELLVKNGYEVHGIKCRSPVTRVDFESKY